MNSSIESLQELGQHKVCACVALAVHKSKTCPAEQKSSLPATAGIEVLSCLVELGTAQEIAGSRIAVMGLSAEKLMPWYEAALYFSFELFVAVPTEYNAEGTDLPLLLSAGAHIFLTHDERLALDGAQAVVLGPKRQGPVFDEDNTALTMDEALARFASPKVLLLTAKDPYQAHVLQALSEV